MLHMHMSLQAFQLTCLRITVARYILIGVPCFNTEHKITLDEIIIC